MASWGLLTVALCLCYSVRATFIEQNVKSRQHVTRAHRPPAHRPAFNSDQDVSRYLKLHGNEAMIWRCKNAIKRHWYSKPLPYIELYCEVIGRMSDVAWHHRGEKIDLYNTGGKHELLVLPHRVHGRYFSHWIDFHLRIHNATRADRGVYTFHVTGLDGVSLEQKIYLDINDRRRKTNHRGAARRRRSRSGRGQRGRRRRSRQSDGGEGHSRVRRVKVTSQ